MSKAQGSGDAGKERERERERLYTCKQNSNVENEPTLRPAGVEKQPQAQHSLKFEKHG